MKNKIILLIIILIASNSCCFAIQTRKSVSDNTINKEVLEDLDSINQYTDNLFTPSVRKIVKSEQNKNTATTKGEEQQTRGSVAPVKKLRLAIKNYKKSENKSKQAAVAEDIPPKDQALLDCDFMQYFADRTELEAEGHAVMFFPQNNSTIKADKMIYNQTTNFIKAFGNVVLISEGKELFGDYMQIDMNEENALMDNPVSDVWQIRAKAKKGYMYGDKIIQEQGSMYVTKSTKIDVRADMFGPDLDTMYLDPKDKSYYMKDSHGAKFKIKTNDLIINSKKEHDTVTLKHAEIYFNEKKVGTIPSITMHTNKAQDYAEADYPELGTLTNMGLYAGPGFVFDTPKGTTLKLIPIINYQSNGDNASDNKLGWGTIAKFKSATNKTDMGYGTANDIFILRGYQKLDDNLYFQYASNSYMDDWFMGYRMPRLLGELVYHDQFLNPNFLGRNKDMVYSHRATAAYAADGDPKGPLFDSGVGTARFKYMGSISQTLYKFNDELTSPVNARFDIVGQGSTAVYGTGDTQAVARIGPMLHSQYKYWMQDVGYFLSAYDDKTPLVGYDRYVYGCSNVYFRESLRLCKYLTVSWLASLNLSQDSWNGKMFQENGFYFGIGPDDIKLNIGYDTIRQQSFVTMALHLDAKGSSIEYKKMIIKNPDTLGKKENGDNNPLAFSSAPKISEDSGGIEKAEVIDIKEAL